MTDDIWADYLEKMRQLEQAVKLTAFWTEETAKATMLTAYFTEEVVRNVNEYLTRQGIVLVETDSRLEIDFVPSQKGLESVKGKEVSNEMPGL